MICAVRTLTHILGSFSLVQIPACTLLTWTACAAGTYCAPSTSCSQAAPPSGTRDALPRRLPLASLFLGSSKRSTEHGIRAPPFRTCTCRFNLGASDVNPSSARIWQRFRCRDDHTRRDTRHGVRPAPAVLLHDDPCHRVHCRAHRASCILFFVSPFVPEPAPGSGS